MTCRGQGLRSSTKALDPSVLPIGRAITKTHLPDMYGNLQDEVLQKMKKVTAVCLTTDCWTSVNFMSVTCHYVDGFQFISHLLDYFSLTECVMHRSTTVSKKLKATQQQMGSTYHILEMFVEIKDAIITTLALVSVNPTLNTFSEEEWEKIQQACEALKPLHDVIVEASAEKQVVKLIIH